MNQPLKFIDLFAGIGGLSIPFREAGMVCVFSSEWDKYCQKTYEVNYHEKPFGDINQIKASQIPDFDILLAGFPCQPFSIAGIKKGFDDERGSLIFKILEILKIKSPQAFLLENVKGLISHNKQKTFNTIINELKKIKYTVFFKILNAKDFGLPQNRERIYIIGFRDHKINFNFPQPSFKKTKLSDILINKVDQKYTISDALWTGHKLRKQKHLNNGNGFGYKLFNQNSPYSSTLSARYYKDGSEILIQQNNNNPRKLTPLECARLQGFPSNFKIVVSDTQAYKQFGNSVAVNVVRSLANNIVKLLK